MKTPLYALMLVATFAADAQAETALTIGGVIQANFKNYAVGNSTRPTTTEYRIDDDLTSRFWLKGEENLGGGNSAIFYIQNRLNTDVSSTSGIGNGLSNGDTYLGLKGAWGQVTLGKHQLMSIEGIPVEYGGNPMPAMPTSLYATATMLNFVGGQPLSVTRMNNSILYQLPKSSSGFFGSIAVSTGGGNGNEGIAPAAGGSNYADGYQLYLKANFAKGPYFLNLAYWTTQFEGRPTTITPANADQRQVRLSASYAFHGGLKIGVQLDRASLAGVGRVAGIGGTDITRTAWEVPISYTIGPRTLLASFTRAGDFSTAADSGAKMWVIGYNYALSKRTNIGVFYGKLSNDGAGTYTPFLSGTSATGSALLAGESARTAALGIKHAF
ncbi:MAG: porin [Burkholderiales bacterium]|nr:porin [Burkholderiales bacterium]